MKTIIIFILIYFSVCSSWANEIYNVEYISFGTNFFTPTTYENFHMRVEKKFLMSDKFLSRMIVESKDKCRLKPIDNEPRVVIKKNGNVVLMINVEKTFVTKLNLCNFDKSLEVKVIESIDRQASKTK